MGLGIGAANMMNNHESKVMEQQRIRLERERVRLQEEQGKLEQKSLKALNSINRVLTTPKL